MFWRPFGPALDLKLGGTSIALADHIMHETTRLSSMTVLLASTYHFWHNQMKRISDSWNHFEGAMYAFLP